jgi:hypothetical protein
MMSRPVGVPLPDKSEPVFTIKAKDNLAVAIVRSYLLFCEVRGLEKQADEVAKALLEIEEWRAANPSKLKWPDHMHKPAKAST